MESVTVYEGVALFDTDLDHAVGEMIKNFQHLFRDVESYGESNILDVKTVNKLLEDHTMTGKMNVAEFASLFSWFRPDWELVVEREQVKFTETGLRPTTEYEIIAQTRRIPKAQYVETSSIGLIVAIGEDELMYVRPATLVENYLWMKKELREYAALFDDNLDENLKDHVKAVFLGDCVLWYDETLLTFLRCQVRKILERGLVELECIDEGRRVSALATDLFPLPRRLRRGPAFCVPFESCSEKGEDLDLKDRNTLKTVAKNLMLQQLSCVFSFKWRTDNGKFPDSYRGVWKPVNVRY